MAGKKACHFLSIHISTYFLLDFKVRREKQSKGSLPCSAQILLRFIRILPEPSGYFLLRR